MKGILRSVSRFMAVVITAGTVFNAVPELQVHAESKMMKQYGYDYAQYMDVFDPDYYAALYPDLAQIIGYDEDKLLEHFVLIGMKEGRRGCLEFDPVWYSNAYPYLKNMYGNDWTSYYMDFITSGARAERDGSYEYRMARLEAEAEPAKINAGHFMNGEDGLVYFYRSDGVTAKGWIRYGNDYYYLDRITGVLHFNETVNGVQLGEDGKAVLTQYALEKIPCMIKGRQIAEIITEPADTVNTKIRRAMAYSTHSQYIMKDAYIGTHRKVSACVPAHYANNIWNLDGTETVIGGECYAWSSVCAFIVNEMCLGDVYLEDDTKHGWLEVNGLFYDLSLTRANTDYKSYFAIKRNRQYRRVNAEKI